MYVTLCGRRTVSRASSRSAVFTVLQVSGSVGALCLGLTKIIVGFRFISQKKVGRSEINFILFFILFPYWVKTRPKTTLFKKKKKKKKSFLGLTVLQVTTIISPCSQGILDLHITVSILTLKLLIQSVVLESSVKSSQGKYRRGHSDLAGVTSSRVAY